MYKIFINDSALILIEKDNLSSIQDKTIIQVTDVDALIRKILLSIDEPIRHEYYILDNNPKEILEQIQAKCKFIKAAGGIITNPENKYLVIKRNKKWDFPKGKVEKNETMRTAAKREVIEETGVKELTVLEKALSTYHVYIIKKNIYLKKTNWYYMISLSKEKLVPQLEEGISKVKWVDIDFMREKNVKTYQSIKEIVNFLPLSS